MQHEKLEFDVVIVGAGPAGLATAIALAQRNPKLQICLLEKGAQVGAHSISGAVLEADALSELIPGWKSLGAPVNVEVTSNKFYYLSSKKYHKLPILNIMSNKENYVISLSELCRWLANYAEKLGVNIFPGFAASEVIYDTSGAVIGVKTADFGLNKQGQPTNRQQPGIHLFAKQTVFAEGCRGSLSQKIMAKFKLEGKSPQSYAIGIKEIWRIAKENHRQGEVVHTVGWPLNQKTYGGGFVYHFKDQLLSLGMIIGLDYSNPYLSPYHELQRFKLHPLVRPLLSNAECVEYGSRALNEGGWQALPKLVFPGGLFVGCAAGMVNTGKLKGIHNAIRSGILAAQALFENLSSSVLTNYQQAFKRSRIYSELYQVRNLRPSFHFGLWAGLAYSAFDQSVLFARAPWTFGFKPDYQQLKPKRQSKPINYPKSDNKLTFSKSHQVYLSNVKHREDQPCHLILKNPRYPVEVNLREYAGPEARYCPAGVYEFTQKEGKKQLTLHPSNCIHCKTCDIKDPRQNIIWQVPEGGSGPFYTLM